MYFSAVFKKKWIAGRRDLYLNFKTEMTARHGGILMRMQKGDLYRTAGKGSVLGVKVNGTGMRLASRRGRVG
jgi:hypothetical protein